MNLGIVNQLIETRNLFTELLRQNYFENVLFSYQWWFLLIITVGLWAAWIFLMDKQNLHAILLVGLLTALFALVADEFGLLTFLWSYSYHLFPFTMKLLSVDLAIVPVSFMLLYQYARQWKTYIIVLILLTLFAVIAAEPLFEMLDIYTLHKWEHWYSTPIYFLMGIFVKWFADKIRPA